MAMVEVEFRDGARLVPAHVADLLERYETITMTHKEAVHRANSEMAKRYANDAMQKAIDLHLDRFNR